METCLLAAGVAILVVSLGLASVSDLSNRTIPNACVVSAALAVMPLAVVAPDLPAALRRSLCGAVVVVALLAVAASLCRGIHGHDGVGAGDVKLLGALGLWAGPVGGLAVVGASCLLALAGRAAILRIQKSAPHASRVALCRDGSMPMAPAIFAAALLTYAMGLWAW